MSELADEIEETVEKIEQELHYEWRQLRHYEAWVPAFIDCGGYKTLDIERLQDDMDSREWSYYRAGLIEGYGKAVHEFNKVLKDDE